MSSNFRLVISTFVVLQVGVAYLMALEYANNLVISPTENIEYDR